MSEENNIDKFGKFLVENLRDKGISHAEFILNGRWKAPALQNIQYELSYLSFSTHDKFSFRGAQACHPEPVEGARVVAFAHHGSTSSP